jgi:hypothetical protein
MVQVEGVMNWVRAGKLGLTSLDHAYAAHGYLIPAEDLAARNHASVGRKARLGADLVWVVGGPVWPRCPDRPNRHS